MSVSLRKSINDKCRDCLYDEKAPGTWRKQVELCPCTDCPLYPVRPKTKPRRLKNECFTGNSTGLDRSKQEE